MSVPDYTRHGFGSVRPYIHGPLELLDFVEDVFGAKELERHAHNPQKFHVEYQIGDSVLVVEAGPLPSEYPAWTSSIYVYVEDVDGTIERAVARGAEIVMGIADQEYLERSGGVKDMAGNIWWISRYRGDCVSLS